MDIIAALETAGSPNPHLDAEIEATINGGVPAYRCSDSMRKSYGPSAIFTKDDGSNIMPGDWHSAPSFTGSVDAALTLIVEGMRIFELGQWDDNGKPAGWYCSILRWKRHSVTGWAEHEYAFTDIAPDNKIPPLAPTPAIAICVAAMKARLRHDNAH